MQPMTACYLLVKGQHYPDALPGASLASQLGGRLSQAGWPLPLISVLRMLC